MRQQTFFYGLLLLFFFASCDQRELPEVEEESQVQTISKMNEMIGESYGLFNPTIDPMKLDRGNPCLRKEIKTDQTIVWEGNCTDAEGPDQIPAADLINNLFRSCLPVYDNSICFEEVITNSYSYFENEQGCEPLYNHLDFQYQYGMTGSEVAGIAGWIYNSVISNFIPSGYVLLGIEVPWTSHFNCERFQSFSVSCVPYNEPMIYPCHAQWWATQPDCSLCKDLCERRGLAISVRLGKLCKESLPDHESSESNTPPWEQGRR